MRLNVVGVNPVIAWLFVAKRRKSPWIQGVAIEATGGDLVRSLRRPSERNAVDEGICTAVVGYSWNIRVHWPFDA
jgi:hypothetical protein